MQESKSASWQFFRKGWDGHALLVLVLKNPSQYLKKEIVLAYYESVLSSMFQCCKITVCNVFFNFRIDDIEDEIYREKLKIKKVSDELSDTFDDMLDNY